MAHAVQFTLRSRNRKVGPMPVSTTSSDTCPDACPLKGSGCYAESGPLGMLWAAINKAKPGERVSRGRDMLQTLTWSQFVASVKALPIGTLWRHNQAGDLPGNGDKINTKALAALVEANSGKRGFTYTHKPINDAGNAQAIADANARGFTINLSADNLQEADELAAAAIAPVVVVLPDTIQGKQTLATPAGNRVIVCPATYSDVACIDCQLCARVNRKTIVGFPAHGVSKRKASAIAMAVQS